jgi:hypothetical protein
MMRLTIAVAMLLALGGCVVAPAPYGYPGYGYAPGYVAAPPIVVGFGGGWGWHGGGGGYGRRW